MLRIALPLLVALFSPDALFAQAQVEIIAHRGASHNAPENTVAAIKLAWQQDADGSEFDIWLTKDGKIAVLHDKDTKRTTGVTKLVHQTTLAELRSLDAGKWKAPQFAGEKIPTLEEMLATIPPQKQVFIEVKCGPEIVPVLNRSLAAAKLPPRRRPSSASTPTWSKDSRRSGPRFPLTGS